MEFFVVKFKEQYDTDKGPKWATKQWIVQAVSVTDAEVKVVQELSPSGIEFEVTSISKSAFEKVIQDV